MPFNPQVDEVLVIEDTAYRIAEHPAAPGIPYGQEGRQAVVYQLITEDGEKRALKAFKPRYRLPGLVSLADRFASFAELPGLLVCDRTVLSTRTHAELLRRYPDLTYAVLMPWIEGPTWLQVVLEQRQLTQEQSSTLGRELLRILSRMEQHDLAHCDLSSPNVIFPELNGGKGLQLVDVEQIYAPTLDRPEVLPGGSPGYAHDATPDEIWGPEADRFAGGILLAEMLAWPDKRVRDAAWGESYFAPEEMHKESDRFQILLGALRRRRGQRVTDLLERTWFSKALEACPTFEEWSAALEERKPDGGSRPTPVPDFEHTLQKTWAEIEEQMAPQREQTAALEEERRERLDALYGEGLHALQREAWPEALEALDAVRHQEASFADVRQVAPRAEAGWLASAVPETAAPLSPNAGAQDWATRTAATAMYADWSADHYVPPRNYQRLREVLLEHQMLILDGPPGIGKRSTALALARDVAQGEGEPPLVLRPDASPEAIAETKGSILIWPNPFGLSTFAPPPLADRIGVLREAVRHNHLIVTTPSSLRAMALRTTALGLWPVVTETSQSLTRDDYELGDLADILDRHADLAETQGMLTPRQRELVAAPERREALAAALDAPLTARLFLEHKLPSLDPKVAWSTQDLTLMIGEVRSTRQCFTAWFAEARPTTCVFLTVLSWLAEQPQARVSEVYTEMTQQLRDLCPGLPVVPIRTLAHRTRFCVSAGGSLRFKHPVYEALTREVIADVGQAFALRCLEAMETHALSAAAEGGEGNQLPVNVGLMLGELLDENWEQVTAVLERLAASPSPRMKWSVGRGLMHAAQQHPAALPSLTRLLQDWSRSEDEELHLTALQAVGHLGRTALDDLNPVLSDLIEDQHPGVRSHLVDVAVDLSCADWEGALSILRRLGSDPEEPVRETVASGILRLARRRRRAVWSSLLAWAEEGESLLHGTLMRVLVAGQDVFSLEETVPVYERLLSREDDAGTVLASHLIQEEEPSPWSLNALTELAREPTKEVRGQMEHVLRRVAPRNPEAVVTTLCGWTAHQDNGVRETALRLMAEVGKTRVPRGNDPTSSAALGRAYAGPWFKSLQDLAIDPLPAIRARLVSLAHDFSSVDAEHTVETLAILTRDTMPRIRQLTALALAPLAEPYAAKAVPILEGLVEDDDPRVREAAIPALADGVAEVEVPPALEMLASLVRDPAISDAATRPFVRVASARPEDGAVTLAELAKDSDPAQREAILEIAGKTAISHPTITASLLSPVATDRDRTRRERVVDVCHVVAQYDPGAPLPVLAALVPDRDAYIRAQATDELVDAGLRTPEAGLQILRRLAEQHRAEVQLLVLTALERFVADHAEAVLPIVSPLVNSREPAVRQATLPVLAAAGEHRPAETLELLSRLLVDGEVRIRDEARNKFLSLCVTRNPSLLPVLSELVDSSNPKVFLPVLEGLAHFTATQPDAVLTAVEPVVEGGASRAQEAALPLLEQLAESRLTDVAATLAVLLETEDEGGPAHKLYWRVMRLPEGCAVVTEADGVVDAVAVNPRWESKSARRALSLGERTVFMRKRMVAKITGNMED
jgi:hypothetical protein